MHNTGTFDLQKAFLLVAAVGLTPIALGYGAAPQRSLMWLFGINAEPVNVSHIFRAVMGLYLALVMFWLMGAFRPSLRFAALCSLTVFMLGLAAGRLLSLLLDGTPHPLLLVYLVLELIMGGLGLWMINRGPTADR